MTKMTMRYRVVEVATTGWAMSVDGGDSIDGIVHLLATICFCGDVTLCTRQNRPVIKYSEYGGPLRWFAVTDYGVDMPFEQLQRILDRLEFYTKGRPDPHAPNRDHS